MPPSSLDACIVRSDRPKHVVQSASLTPEYHPGGLWRLTLHLKSRKGFRSAEIIVDVGLGIHGGHGRGRVLRFLTHAHTRLSDRELGWRPFSADSTRAYGVVTTRHEEAGLLGMCAILFDARSVPVWYRGIPEVAIQEFLLRLDLSRAEFTAH